MKTLNLLNRLGMVCAAAIVLASAACKKNNNNMGTPDPMEETINGPDVPLFALTPDNRLLNTNAKDPSTTATINITGLQTGETLAGIDYRPATGQLYGVGSSSTVYTINTTTGVARAVGAAFTPALNNTTVGFDFNPTVDRIRLVTSTGQNLRLHPETGAVAVVDGSINGAAGASVTAAAYTNNRAGQATTVLFVIDAATDKLYKQDPPNDGKLVEVGALGFDAQQAGGFDISSNGTALASLKKGGVTSLYTIDLTTGKATRIKNSFLIDIIGIAIPTEPVAYAINTANELVIFNPMNPSPVTKAITGTVLPGEAILGIDFRPATNSLYALGASSRIYTINLSSGAAAVVGTAPFATLLAGTDFGFDFNPMADRLRIISNTGQNLRVNPNDGLLAAMDTNLSPGTPSVTGAAYTNNIAGATSTVLFDIDTQTSRLVKQDPLPNGGILVDVGALGVTATAANGFDIGSTSGVAYALLTVGGTTKVYTINLTTGAATAGATLAATVKGFTVGLGF